jgi:hypothetical protein
MGEPQGGPGQARRYDYVKAMRALGRFSEGDKKHWNKHIEIFLTVTRAWQYAEQLELLRDSIVAPASYLVADLLAPAQPQRYATIEAAITAVRKQIFPESYESWSALRQPQDMSITNWMGEVQMAGKDFNRDGEEIVCKFISGLEDEKERDAAWNYHHSLRGDERQSVKVVYDYLVRRRQHQGQVKRTEVAAIQSGTSPRPPSPRRPASPPESPPPARQPPRYRPAGPNFSNKCFLCKREGHRAVECNTCAFCGRQGHHTNLCRELQGWAGNRSNQGWSNQSRPNTSPNTNTGPNTSPNINIRKCFNCNRTGHISSQCTMPRAAAAVHFKDEDGQAPDQHDHEQHQPHLNGRGEQ